MHRYHRLFFKSKIAFSLIFCEMFLFPPLWLKLVIKIKTLVIKINIMIITNGYVSTQINPNYKAFNCNLKITFLDKKKKTWMKSTGYFLLVFSYQWQISFLVILYSVTNKMPKVLSKIQKPPLMVVFLIFNDTLAWKLINDKWALSLPEL